MAPLGAVSSLFYIAPLTDLLSLLPFARPRLLYTSSSLLLYILLHLTSFLSTSRAESWKSREQREPSRAEKEEDDDEQRLSLSRGSSLR